MTAPGQDGYPEPFVPAAPEWSLVQRLTWPLSRTGRARRRLEQALRFPGDSQRLERVARAAAGLVQRHTTTRAAERALLPQLQAFLTWRALEDSRLAHARTQLAALAEHEPPAAGRVGLRWRLLRALGAGDAYREEAESLLVDPLLDPASHRAAIEEVVRTLYEKVSPAACGRVLARAHRRLQQDRALDACLKVCRRPGTFGSPEAAREGVSGIDDQLLDFSPILRADALLLMAEAAEWEADWQAMSNRAARALEVAPDHRPGCYWSIRAALHDVEARPAEMPAPLPDSLEWRRLGVLARLHREPTLEQAEAGLSVLRGEHGRLAPPERDLTVELLRRSLEPSASWPPLQVAAGAELCQAIEEVTGVLGWTQVRIAHREILVDRLFSSALERLEQENVLAEPDAQELLRVARLLGGAAAAEAHPEPGDALSAMEETLRGLLDPPAKALATVSLRQRIDGARGGPIFRRFPDLGPVARVLGLALRYVGGDLGDTQEGALATELPASAPPWLSWLFARIALLAVSESDPVQLLSSLRLSEPAVSWLLSVWVASFGRRRTSDSEALGLATETVEAALPGLPSAARALASFASEARAGSYRQPVAPAKAKRIPSLFPALGDRCDAVAVADLLIETLFAAARLELAEGNAAEAVRRLDQLETRLARESLMSVAWWRPLVRYWLGVAHAHCGNEEAAEILRSVVGTAKGIEARAQLALLALQEGRLDEAAEAVEGARADVPAVLYARALIHSRRSEPALARQLLGDDAARQVLAGSSYERVAERLLAALEEREGDERGAETRLRQLPAGAIDPIASARRARLCVRRCYAGPTLPAEAPQEMSSLFADGLAAAPWCRDYQLLYELLTSSGDELDEVRTTIETRASARGAAAWRQLLTRRLLAAGDATTALDFTRTFPSAEVPSWYERTRQILEAWEALTSLWRPVPLPGREEIEARAKQLWEESGSQAASWDGLWPQAESDLTSEAVESSLSLETLTAVESLLAASAGSSTENADPIWFRWRRLVELAVATKEAHTPPSSFFGITDGAETEPWPGWLLFDLWSADEERRRRAAVGLEAASADDGEAWPAPARDLLGFLAAHILAKDGELFERYERLVPHLDRLPVDGRRVWLGAAHAAFRSRDWQWLTAETLPPCVEDLRLPEARLVVALAHARAAAATRDSRAADDLAHQARNLLAPLLLEQSKGDG